MANAEYRIALRKLLRADGIADDAVRSILGSVSALRKDLRAILIDSGYYNMNSAGQLIASLDAAMAAHIGGVQAQLGRGIQSAYVQGMLSLESLVMAFEVQYPFGIAVTQAQIEAFTLQTTFSKITMVTEEMQGLIRANVLQGLYLNQTPFQAMQGLTHIMGIRPMYGRYGFSEIGATGITAKAERIVRTEFMTALNMGFITRLNEAAQVLPDLNKGWMSTGDMRTRDSHLIAHGQIVAHDEVFVVGGETCVGPHDPSLSPRERINCRCRAYPIREEWGEEGELTQLIDEEVVREVERRGEVLAEQFQNGQET
jgi:hypothetical protein